MAVGRRLVRGGPVAPASKPKVMMRARSTHIRERLRVPLVSVHLAALLGVACAPSMPPPRSGLPLGYELLEEAGLTPLGFEAAPTDLDPAEVVPRDLLQGPHHVVRSVRLDHRFLYTYRVDSAYGEIEVTGRGLLRKRVMELEALAEFDARGVGAVRRYSYEVANAASDPIEGTMQILRHPVRTVFSIPMGAVASYKAMMEMAELGRTHVEDDYVEEFIGLSGQKRAWAGRIGVDPYSTNPHVQARLTRNGWLSLAGDLTVTLATIPVPAGAATIAMGVVGATSGMGQQLADVAPEDIRVNTRSFLQGEIGLDEQDAERFLEHPWYSPSRQETIIRSLARMKQAAHRDRFVEMAVRADEPHEAYAFTRLALMFAECNDRRSPIDEFFVSHGLVAAHTMGGDVVLPLYMDHGYWTAEIAHAEAEVDRFLEWDRDVDSKLLIVSGQVSSMARNELERRGWEVIDHLEGLWLTEADEARYQPGAADQSRILPQLGR